MAILALYVLLNGLMYIPYQLQLAHGWTSLTIKVTIVVGILIVPAILWVVPIYGAIGAAWMLMATNAGYLIFSIHFMHRRLLPGDKWRWLVWDVAIPLAAATAAALLCRWAMPHDLGKLGEFSVLLITSMCVLIAAAAAAPMVRHQLTRYLRWHRPPLESTLPEPQ
jgi:O-antigen/teichoic acid export membrane protein